MIKFCNRPFANVEEMNEALITNYNNTVGEDDICIWVGDCFWRNKKLARTIMSRLNGKKILVLGNHDTGRESMMNLGFDWACYEMTLRIEQQSVTIKHYPLRWPWWKRWWGRKPKPKYWNRMPKDRGQWHIHGHTHSSVKYDGKQIHVGVDAWKYKPVSINQIAKRIRENT